MKIIISKEVGFCFGVKRAIRLVEDNIKKMEKPVMMYGDLIHNKEVVEKICRLGIKVIHDPDKAQKGTLIITAHGISPVLKKRLEKRINLTLFDTTCCMVLAVHRAAERLKKKGKKVLIFGDLKHQEVIGIKGAAGRGARTFSSKEKLLKIKDKGRYGMVVQTTQDLEKMKEIEKIDKKIEIINTICRSTRDRQREIKRVAREADTVLVIGSKTSANTNRLFQVALRINKNTFFIENEKQLKKEWLKGVIGIGAGASTPELTVNKIIKKINEKKNQKN